MINKILRGGALSLALLSISLGACKKDEAASESPKPVPAAETTSTAPVAPAPEPEPAAAPGVKTSDFFYVEVSHAKPKPTDPVRISFPEVRVLSSSINPDNLTAGTVELELSMSKLDSGIPERDSHLASPDFFDVAKFGTARIKVSDVEAKGEKTFSATSEVTVHGVSKSWTVEFTVVERGEDSITIEAEHNFSRLDFGIGKADGASVATDVAAKLRITLPTV
ncbi:MAG: YceI family protein [Myxococcales bacterium]|nr:YceI family protein [Myxococcales bacterium]